MLKYTRTCSDDDVLNIVTNDGDLIYTTMGDLKLLPLSIHYNDRAIANILSPKNVSSIPHARLTMDTSVERAIVIIL